MAYDIRTARFSCDDCEEIVRESRLRRYKGGEYCRECFESYHKPADEPLVEVTQS